MPHPKPYGMPRIGDIVWHIDEPNPQCYGTVVSIEDDYFSILWYDGKTSAEDSYDHPDIIIGWSAEPYRCPICGSTHPGGDPS